MRFAARLFLFPLAVLIALSAPAPNRWISSAVSTQGEKPEGEKFVYADFEKMENGRPVSNGGGLMQIYLSQESTPVQFKGMANVSPGAPEIVRVKGQEGNHVATFEYTLVGPNQWANVTLEIQGHPNKDGEPVADDVSAYKNLSVQLYATGTEGLRLEFISHGQGIKLNAGFPQIPLRLKPGFNTYLIPLKSLSQPSWVEDKVDTKDVLRKLTAISISAYCNQCTPQHGTVAVDNLVFQK
ncbi:MAG TPA: hypothetical protein VIF81_13750 [Pyrinomonadaceae bacterium]|jgi:hypothetical protein